MSHTLSNIQKSLRLSAQKIHFETPETEIVHLLFDSRHILQPSTSLFFALRGVRNDGHKYVADLYRRGVRSFVVEPFFREKTAEFSGANFIFSEKPLEILQKIAIFHRNQFQYPVVGITGSNGKTVVKEWIFQSLQADFEMVRSPKSWNSQLGVPLSVWQMTAENTLAIFEAGISKMGEMGALEKIIRPTIGILSHLGAAHDEGFATREAKFWEKMRLFKDAETVICAIDDDVIFENLKEIRLQNELTHFISWSKTGRRGADFQIKNIQKVAHGRTKFKVKSAIYDLDDWQFEIPFSDDASLENALHVWCLLFDFGYREDEIDSRLRRLEPVEQRLEIKPAINRSTLINDSWSNDLDSLRIALHFADRTSGMARKTLIISDLLQSGVPKKQLYEEVGRLILAKNFTRLIGIGTEIQGVLSQLPSGFDAHFFEKTDDFLAEIARQNFHEELILLKGARPFLFEKIARRLEQKNHKTVLEINLAALAHNLNIYTNLLKTGVKMCAMVKASGYGSGAVEVARLLESRGVDFLAVAYPDEGVELREAGIRMPILVLNTEPASFEMLLRFGLEPEIFSLEMLEKVANFAQNLPENCTFPIHLKFDTGMRRLGFEENEAADLVKILKKNPSLEVRSVFSHLAASDAEAHDDFTKKQVAIFQKVTNSICKSLKINPLRHILNTGGIARWPDFQFDMVRLGIGLYGVGSADLPEKLRVVNTLKATISQIKVVPIGESVGYNRLGRAEKPMRIATISLGYADGLPRAAGNGRFGVKIHGKTAQTVGNICMDMTMVDVTEIALARAGDEVIVFGDTSPVEELATVLGTIPYEIFTGVSGRVNRVYFLE